MLSQNTTSQCLEARTTQIPPEPLDIPSTHTQDNTSPLNYKEKLLANAEQINLDIDPMDDVQLQVSSVETVTQSQEKSAPQVSGIKTITLLDHEREGLHHPWKFSLIIKLFGKRIVHHYLKAKIQDLWKPTEQFPLIDLGCDYYIVKFTQEENMRKVLQNGPWFINGHFLSIKRWEPNFVAAHAKQTVSVVWIHLPQLPTEFYDESLLKKIGNSIGSLLKIDACTSATLRGRYARLCIQVPLEEPVTTRILIGYHLQQIIYEGEGFLCKLCGRLGHTSSGCSYQEAKDLDQSKSIKDGTTTQCLTNHLQTEEWQTVLFNRRRRHNNRTKTTMEAMTAARQDSQGPGLS
ncbi:PREDICTED: uncharacterized protein LOC109207843 [Nicotiana attenuata]|uniref:uncharacterized protein LOC109207843 n=1 Tax=Nicotiana attenuata TaxID=49451 RepID=UPI000904B17C|nr:PREDICTED: uncharacterized protein LOC109207843 [Nicotiana attenuata]